MAAIDFNLIDKLPDSLQIVTNLIIALGVAFMALTRYLKKSPEQATETSKDMILTTANFVDTRPFKDAVEKLAAISGSLSVMEKTFVETNKVEREDFRKLIETQETVVDILDKISQSYEGMLHLMKKQDMREEINERVDERVDERVNIINKRRRRSIKTEEE